MKKCPFCAEDIQDAATKCKHCGSTLPVQPAAHVGISALVSASRDTEKSRHVVSAVCAVVGGLAIALSPFMPYITTPLISVSGFQKMGGIMAAAELMAGAVAMILGIVAIMLHKSFRRSWGYMSAIACGLNVYAHRHIESSIDDGADKNPATLQGLFDFSVGPGIWITYVGAALLIAAACVGNYRRSRRSPSASKPLKLKGTLTGPPVIEKGSSDIRAAWTSGAPHSTP